MRLGGSAVCYIKYADQLLKLGPVPVLGRDSPTTKWEFPVQQEDSSMTYRVDTYKLNTMIRARKEETSQKILKEHHLNEHASRLTKMLFKIPLEQYYLVYPLFNDGTGQQIYAYDNPAWGGSKLVDASSWWCQV